MWKNQYPEIKKQINIDDYKYDKSYSQNYHDFFLCNWIIYRVYRFLLCLLYFYEDVKVVNQFEMEK